MTPIKSDITLISYFDPVKCFLKGLPRPVCSLLVRRQCAQALRVDGAEFSHLLVLQAGDALGNGLFAAGMMRFRRAMSARYMSV